VVRAARRIDNGPCRRGRDRFRRPGQAFTVEKTTIVQIGGLSSYLLFALGRALFGLASLRARVFPAVSLGLMLGGLFGFRAGMPPYGVPIGPARAALGGWLIYQDRAVRQLAAPATS
jgi:hypothetical protein